MTFYVGEGKFTGDPIETFGGYGVIQISELQELMHKICTQGFEHHFAVTRGNVAGALQEALANYLGMQLI
jgi:L-fucose isomerase-like protein